MLGSVLEVCRRPESDRIPIALNACCRSTTRHGWSWSFQILPYLEQSAVYDMVSESDDPVPPSASVYNPMEDLVAQQAISTYYCPSRRDPKAHGSDGTVYGIPPISDIDASMSVGGTWTTIVDKGGRSWGRWHPFFGSSHSGGTNFCLADGSVRFISETVNDETFRRLSLTNDGEPVELD